VVFAPGQVLAPVDQLVEQFGTVMLAASVALGMQKLLLALGGQVSVAVCLSLGAATYVWCLWRGLTVPAWLRSALLALLLLRFLVPLVSLGNEALFQALLAPAYVSSQAGVSGSTQALQDTALGVSAPGAPASASAASTPAPGWWQRFQDQVAGTQDALSLKPAFSALQTRAEALVEQVVTLLAVFMLQTVVMPMALVWLLWRGLLLWLRPSPRAAA
jgi:hypothetical protein